MNRYVEPRWTHFGLYVSPETQGIDRGRIARISTQLIVPEWSSRLVKKSYTFNEFLREPRRKQSIRMMATS